MRPRLGFLPLLAAGVLATGCHIAVAQDGCQRVNAPAQANFDFTGDLTRWGSKDPRLAGTAPLRVRSITVNPLPIFDEANPDEDGWIYRTANNLHFNTQKSVIE